MSVEVRVVQTAAEEAVPGQFEAVAGTLPGSPDIQAERRAALARFRSEGLPHRRVEEWKYTDLRRVLGEMPAPVQPTGAPIGPETLAELDTWKIVIVDGGIVCLPDGLADQGVSVTTLADTLADAGGAALLEGWPAEARSSILELNTAFMATGIIVSVPDGVHLDKPVHIAAVTTVPEAAAFTSRHAITVGANASATVIESYEGPDGVSYLVNTANKIAVGRDSALTWVKIQRDGTAATHLSTATIEVDQGARLTCAPITIGAALSRNQFAMAFDGEHADVNVTGVQLLGGRQHGDTTLFVDHALPNGASRELFKSVLDGRARGVFQGKIVVRQDAQKVDGRMMAQSLMLSDQAEADSKPELEIYADDVQCGHGSTSGRIDEDLLFYLRARGIPEVTAKALLIEAFIGEAVEAIGNEAIAEALSSLAHDWVVQHAGGASGGSNGEADA